MNNPLLDHDQRTNFADDFSLGEFEENNYDVDGAIQDEIYEGVDDAGIFGNDDSTGGGGPIPPTPNKISLTVCEAGVPTTKTFWID